jgi:hypothetical protein
MLSKTYYTAESNPSEISTSNSYAAEDDISVINPNDPIEVVESIPLPLTSVLSTAYDPNLANCPFKILADQKNYYVKLTDVMNENKTAAVFFIRSGEELVTKVPSGVYKLKYGAGNDWQGEQELFGQFAQYKESEQLHFVDNGYIQNGNVVSFYDTVQGNFQSNITGRDAVLQN